MKKKFNTMMTTLIYCPGTWMCQYDGELGAAKWVQIACDAPRDLKFATSAVSLKFEIQSVD